MELDLEQNVCTVIYGENLDNDRQKNNGSGKSSIVEAIVFGITGDSAKKAPSMNDIINDFAEEMSATLTFVNDYDKTRFVVEREVSRDGGQRITCKKYNSADEEIEEDKTVQPSVLDYNRFILEELGVTKDELYTCYILNNSRFKSFFQASDKEKKEIINNFSNGVLVDQAVEKLDIDIEKATEELSAINDNALKESSAVQALEEQILAAEEKSLNAEEDRKKRIAELERNIADERAAIRQREEQITNANDRLGQFKEACDWLSDLEESDADMQTANKRIADKFSVLRLSLDKDYTALLEDKKAEIARMEKDACDDQAKMLQASETIQSLTRECAGLRADYDKVQEDCDSQDAENSEQIKKLEATLEQIAKDAEKDQEDLAANARSLKAVQMDIHKLEAQMNGAVECPVCGAKFALDTKADVKEIASQLEAAMAKSKDIDGKISQIKEYIKEDEEDEAKIRGDIKGCLADREVARKRVQSVLADLNGCQRRLRGVEDEYSSIKARWSVWEDKKNKVVSAINSIRDTMFFDARQVIDAAAAKGHAFIDGQKSAISASNGIIDTLKKTIETVRSSRVEDVVANLKKGRKEHLSVLEKVKEEQVRAQGALSLLTGQKDFFIRFKSHLANKKIDAISEQVNSFLEQIGSDMRIELSGFKVLKSKKVREKITMTILRDGVDGGAFEKFSGGERARIILAGILAMRHLTNINCENGKGLDFLILDEILDASDHSGLMSYAETLTNLGITTLLITQGAVTESYPHQLLVQKELGVSHTMK